VRVHLDYLELLLLVGCEVVAGKAYTVEDRENDETDVILLDLLTDAVYQVGLCAGLGQILEVSGLGQVLLAELGHQRFAFVHHHSLLVLHAVLLIFF
jgi:hypothetical protein